MKELILITLLSFIAAPFLSGQGQFKSIHQEQSEYYNNMGCLDGLDGLENTPPLYWGEVGRGADCMLGKRVFGYHPYWNGNTYLNYQWNLISDLCYFSYELDPYTGDPVTVHDWLTDPAIDSALSNDVKVHLCVTLFSDHAAFFNNPVAGQTLITNLVELVRTREAHGVNIDFEAVPFSQSEVMNDYLVLMADQLHDSLPGTVLSIALPAVDWTLVFDIPLLEQHFDLFFIMGYDYYWNGSTQAGPVAPLYSMTSSYEYNLSRTLSYYQKQGLPASRIILGLPYYGRQWKTQGAVAPSNVIGSGSAMLYSTIKNGSSYSQENRKWQPESFSNYYSFYLNNSWYQCFLNELDDLSERYDLINHRGLAGLGIWALGYDNGYPELWQMIADKFTDCAVPVYGDTLYDSGGPYWNYYNDEDYLMTFTSDDSSPLTVEFIDFDLNADGDYLYVFDGSDTNGVLIGQFTGNLIPGAMQTSGSSLTLRFISGSSGRNQGWVIAVRNNTYLVDEQIIEDNDTEDLMNVFPNPTSGEVNIRLRNSISNDFRVEIIDIQGKVLERIENERFASNGDFLTCSMNLNEITAHSSIINVALWSDGRKLASRIIILSD